MATGSDGLPLRETGPWVHDKNFYLDRYLSIFSRGVSRKWQGNLAYVDLFAGFGRNVVRDRNEEVEGSPFLALKHDFAKYVFVDLPEVVRVLEERLATHPKRSKIDVVAGDCNDVIATVLRAVPPNFLTLAFIDPTGIQIRFQTLRRLVRRRKADLLMTIQFGMAIRMNLPQYSRTEREKFTAFLGTGKWREEYKKGGSISQIGRGILGLYLNQLASLGYQTVRDREIVIHSDQRNLFLYVILFASRHPRGADFWRKITSVTPSGQRLFDFPSSGVT